jgi:hypothetical protein
MTEETLPPEVFGTGEVIFFFPTVEFLEEQAKYNWGMSGDYYVWISSYNGGSYTGVNPYLYVGAIADIKEGNNKFYRFSSDDIRYFYNESSALFSVSLPDKISFDSSKLSSSKKTIYISHETVPIIGGSYAKTDPNLLLVPFFENATTIHSNFLNTSVDGYFLGVAKDVNIVRHENGTNVILYNSSQDFIEKCLNQFDNTKDGATFCPLNPILSLGTAQGRPGIVTDYNTAPVLIESNKGNVIYDCLFLFRASEPDYSDALVCYAAPLEKDYCIISSSESDTIPDQVLKGNILEISEIRIKTELTWETIII